MARKTAPKLRPPKRPPLILVSNDDGVHAPGIQRLARAMEAIGEVWVVAPENEQSTTSHSLSLARPLRLRELKPRWWALDGTPADCTYVALHHKHLLPRPASIVVSGINMGLNLGTDVFYSGTVAAAREAALRGTDAIAFSMPTKADASRCATRARTMVARMLAWRAANPKAATSLVNVNFPAERPKGVRVCTLGVREYDNLVEIRSDPRGRQYLWLGGPSVVHPRRPGSDTEAYDEGYVSVTPLRLDLDLTDVSDLARTIAGR